METDKYIFFYGHKPNNLGVHVFSQWFPCKFNEYYDKDLYIAYDNTEQYMMAHKAFLFGDDETLEKILNTSDPYKIKQYGRTVKNFNEDVWNKHKFEIVLRGNRLKFGQNPKLMAVLKSTGNKKIAEASPYDKIWGIGISAQKAITMPEEEWPGNNLLGKILMQIRDEN